MPRMRSSITSVAGILVGHFTDSRRPTGCTVVLAPGSAVAGVDVRGAAPGTRETDLLHPSNVVERVHGVLLSGGSAWGLDAAGGVMRWLDEQGIGMTVGPARLPIVPASICTCARELSREKRGAGRVHPASATTNRNAAPFTATAYQLPGSTHVSDTHVSNSSQRIRTSPEKVLKL